jgi:hypothetical protein
VVDVLWLERMRIKSLWSLCLVGQHYRHPTHTAALRTIYTSRQHGDGVANVSPAAWQVFSRFQSDDYTLTLGRRQTLSLQLPLYRRLSLQFSTGVGPEPTVPPFLVPCKPVTRISSLSVNVVCEGRVRFSRRPCFYPSRRQVFLGKEQCPILQDKTCQHLPRLV